MELLIALSIIIAVAEIKDWKHSKSNALLLSEIASLRRGNKELNEHIKTANVTLMVVQNIAETAIVRAEENAGTLSRMQESIEKSESNSAAILKEYELNGVQMGFQRKHPDFIEGL